METLLWKIGKNQIDEFRKSQPGAGYISPLSPTKNDVEWQMTLFPFLNLKSMPKSYGKVMIYYNMRCNETDAANQDIFVFEKQHAMGQQTWPLHTQQFSELSELEEVSFSCNIRILRIEYKNGGPNYEYPLEISSVPKQDRFIWNIDEELTRKIATATTGKRFAGDVTISPSGLFNITLCPNLGIVNELLEGLCLVYFYLCALPKGVSGLKVKYEIVAAELGEIVSATKTFDFDDSSKGDIIGQSQDLEKLKSLNITVNTEILEVYDETGSVLKGVQFKRDGMYTVS